MWSVFARIQTVCAGYFYPTGDEPKVTRDVGSFLTNGAVHQNLIPNITGGNGTNISDTGVPFGSFVNEGDVAGNGGGAGRIRRMSFDASKSSSIYGNSATVEPNAIRALACIKT